jgi:hypothetical protein
MPREGPTRAVLAQQVMQVVIPSLVAAVLKLGLLIAQVHQHRFRLRRSEGARKRLGAVEWHVHLAEAVAEGEMMQTRRLTLKPGPAHDPFELLLAH